MKKVAIVGGGISGLSIARLLKDKLLDVTVFEKEQTVGGLVRCRKIGDDLFHICGGHVFNSKRKDVMDWFWRIMPQTEFVKTDRNSAIMLAGDTMIPYPIENHFYMLSHDMQMSIIQDLLSEDERQPFDNFDQFLRNAFGKTLYNLYFKPYNQKIWQQDLRSIPIAWLEGKLPVPDKAKIFFNNINHVEEKEFVHSSYWYNTVMGSQRIVDVLAQGVKIQYGCNVEKSVARDGKWIINDNPFDEVVFCGNLKQLPSFVEGVDIASFEREIDNLSYHGTTSVFCEIDANPFTWIYLPDESCQCHRIICTNNLRFKSNAEARTKAIVEFTNQVSLPEIMANLKKTPLHPSYIDHVYNEYTYPVQSPASRSMIASLRTKLASEGFYLLGRFAEWEYYNMDAAMGAAIDLSKMIAK